MRVVAIVGLVTILIALTAAAQEGKEKSGLLEFTEHGYPVQMKAPPGWISKIKAPVSDRSWVRLAHFEEPKTKASLVLSAQAAGYRGSADMIAKLEEQLQSDATKAILKTEVRGGSSMRPDGVLFEYTYKGTRGAEHAVRAYWFYNGKRYRIFGTVREVGWRTVSARMEACIASFRFTSRIFRAKPHNFTDEASNFELYYPDGWTIRLPARGPRVEFKADRASVWVRIYVGDSTGDLEEDVRELVSKLKASRKRRVLELEQTGPETHPKLGFEVVRLDYSRREEGNRWVYRETVTSHTTGRKGASFRIVLVGQPSAFPAGEEDYERIVSSLSFLR